MKVVRGNVVVFFSHKLSLVVATMEMLKLKARSCVLVALYMFSLIFCVPRCLKRKTDLEVPLSILARA